MLCGNKLRDCRSNEKLTLNSRYRNVFKYYAKRLYFIQKVISPPLSACWFIIVEKFEHLYDLYDCSKFEKAWKLNFENHERKVDVSKLSYLISLEKIEKS